MEVFAVFEIHNGSYDDIYKLLTICSTKENALDVIKTASLHDFSSLLKFYIKDIHNLSDPSDDYLFYDSYRQLKYILSEDSEKLKKCFESYFWMSYKLDESIEFDVDNRKHYQGPFELSKEQKNEIESVLQNKVYKQRFDRIQDGVLTLL